MDWLSVSIVNSHLTYYESRSTHERKSSRLVSCFARSDCSMRKGTSHSIRESEICFVLRIIKRNYKLKIFQDQLLKRWAFQLLNLFHVWSNLYFEMLDASLILWIETYSVTLVHRFNNAHFSPKRLFLTKFDLYTWNLWIILMYRNINLLFYG